MTRWTLALLVLSLLGCAHLEPSRARLGRAVAAAHARAEPTTAITTPISQPEGIVDLSEPPQVIDGALEPGPLLAASEVASWLPPDYTGASGSIELRNNCSRTFTYAFANSDTPTTEAEQPRRTLDGHALQTQQVVPGQWLHLWDGERWLAAAMTTAQAGQMSISPLCDTLEVSYELDEAGRISFAIHWERDVDPSFTANPGTASAVTLVTEAQDHPELWGASEDHDRIELRLANLCAETIDYAFVPNLDATPERTATLAQQRERRVEIPAGWWLRYWVRGHGWSGGATTSLHRGVVWITADCLNFGVGDGQTVEP